MQIQIYTDVKMKSREALATRVEGVVKHALIPFRYRVSRVEVHVSDQSGDDGLADNRCTVVVRAEGLQPIAVTHRASTMDQAIEGAVATLGRNLESSLGRAQAVR